MRIIAGRLGGRPIISPHSDRTHPMSDKMRGALFNVLGSLDNLDVLDAFAGSGALGFEAISRGAKRVTFIEHGSLAQRTIMQNIASLGAAWQSQLYKTGVNTWLKANPEVAFDVVLCDPPYDDLQPALLQKLPKHVKPDGIFVLSWPGQEEIPAYSSLTQVANKKYGDGQLVFFRRIS